MPRIIISILLIFIGFQSRSQIALFHAHNKTPNELLLDRFGVDNVTAFSLRKVNSAYSGNCIYVKRLSDNTFRNIGFLNNYLDTADLKTWGSGTTVVVKIWYDQSGFGRNGSNPSSTIHGPIIMLSGVYLNELRVDDNNDDLVFSITPTDLRPFVSVTSGSAFIVFRQISGNGGAIAFHSAPNTPHHSWIDNKAYDNFLSSTRVDFPGYNPTTTFKAHAGINDGTNLSNYKNNVLIDAPKAITFAGTPTIQIMGSGSSSGFNAWKEVILYKATKSTDRSAITADQITFFGL
jgi:hypothetical protein